MTIFKFTEARIRDLPLGSGIHRDTDVKGLMCICHKSCKTFAVQSDVRREKRHVRTVRVKIGRADHIRLAEARNEARKLMATIQSGIDPTAGPESTGITLERALKEHLKERDLSPATVRGYRTLHKIMRDHGCESAVPRPSASADFADVDDDDDTFSVADEHSTKVAIRRVRPVHEGGLTINPKSSVAPDTAKNALRAVNGSGLRPRFDELKQRVVFAGDLPWDEGYGRELTDHTARLVRLLLMEQKQGNDYQPSKENVIEAVMTLAYADKFNPVLDYLDSLTWDGISRFERLFTDGFRCGEDDYTKAVSRCFMVGAVARQRRPGCKLDTMPVIKGPQGSLKSTGFRDLFTSDWFSDAELGDLRSKDAPMNLEGVWVHEFAELAGLRAGDMDVLKAFMSRAADRFRAPYGRTVEDHPRRVVFAGTVNEGGYLSDPTGGRRFWPLDMLKGAKVDLDWIAANRDQLWAEADAAFLTGASPVLPEQLWSTAAERQADETVDDPWADTLSGFLAMRVQHRADFENGTGDYAIEVIDGQEVQPMLREPPLADRVHTKDLLYHLGLDDDRQNRGHTQRVRKVMEALGWRYRRGLRIGGRVAAGYIAEDALS